jgi:23S rRNA (uracil1939-C5)-methyltransferase
LTNHAFGVAHAKDGKVVFVPNTAPGDLALVNVDEDKTTYYTATLVELVESSPVRVKPPCPFFERCGGCSWQHIAYEAQLVAKRDAVVDSLERIAQFSGERAQGLVGTCRPSRRQLGYRNKLEMGATYEAKQGFMLGFYHDRSQVLVTPDKCLLAHKAIVSAPKALRGALSYAQGTSDLGIYRVGLRHSETTGSLEVALWTEPKTTASFPRARVAKVLQDALGPTSIVRVVAAHDKMRDVRKVEVLAGKGYWEERLADLRFYTSAPSFFQINTAQAESLIEMVKAALTRGCAHDCPLPTPQNGQMPLEDLALQDARALDDGSALQDVRIADLYAGGGTFSLPLAQMGAQLVAVEAAGSSVRDLRRNVSLNGLNMEIIGGDSERELPALGPLDALIVDPPRTGLTKGIVTALAQTAPGRVIYVSCNPATWARDIARLEQAGYHLQEAHPVDLFPQTPHVEVVSVLTRESGE